MDFTSKRALNILMATSLFCFLTTSCKTLEPGETDRLTYAKNTLTKEITRMIEETGIPSISIALIEKDSVVWTKAFGYANLKTKTPATVSTTYSTGSNVKPFMSMAIMQLVEKGIVDLDEPVNDYLKTPIPSFSENSRPITLRHLLSHQSGIPSSAVFVPIWGKDHKQTLEEIASKVKPVREPGILHEYCNDGFVIAALVVEHKTGKKYEDYVKEHILKPLGLENIDFSKPTPEVAEEMAFPYKIIYNKALPIDQQYSFPYPAGGLTYMTPSQMSRFLIAHLNNGIYKGNRLLKPELMKQFHETSFGHEYYGLGMGVEKKNNYTYLFHNGQDAYSSSFVINLDLKTGVYVMASAESYHQMVALAQFASELMDGKRNLEPLPSFAKKEYKKMKINENELNKVVGTYKIEGTEFNLTILKKKDQLYLKNPVNVEYEILPYEKNKFFLKTEEEQLEFTKGKNGISELILHSRGTKIIAKRTK